MAFQPTYRLSTTVLGAWEVGNAARNVTKVDLSTRSMQPYATQPQGPIVLAGEVAIWDLEGNEGEVEDWM